jgi:hypothetical protein
MNQSVTGKPMPSEGFPVSQLIGLINDATLAAKQRLDDMQSEKGDVSVASMFQMQFEMNVLTQKSEMGVAVIQACNGAIMSATRGMKGG